MNDHRHINYNRAFGIGIALNVAFILFEAACGSFSDSLAMDRSGRKSAHCCDHHDRHLAASDRFRQSGSASRNEIHDRFGIAHVTLQVERSDAFMDCGD
jgi:Co/Zn/Cd efflux system component